MKDGRWTIVVGLAIALLAGTSGIRDSSAQAPPSGFKRTELSRHDSSTPGHEIVLARADFQPGGAVAKHTHPGEEVAYLLEGELILEVEGKPPQHLKAGDNFYLAGGTVHAAKNPGKKGAAVLATYIIEKGKPLATPVAPAAAPAK
jgi:quercetin dioxygenase-like cupin family protein